MEENFYSREAHLFSSSGRGDISDGILWGHDIIFCGNSPSGSLEVRNYVIENGFEFFDFAKFIHQEKNLTRLCPFLLH